MISNILISVLISYIIFVGVSSFPQSSERSQVEGNLSNLSENSSVSLSAKNDSTDSIASEPTTLATTVGTAPSSNENLQNSVKTGCVIGSQRFFEGQFMPGVGEQCQVCYCLRGRQQCSDVQCQPPVKGCQPVLKKGQCCPVRYDCGKEQEGRTINTDYDANSFRSIDVADSELLVDDESVISSKQLGNQVRSERENEPTSLSENDEQQMVTSKSSSDNEEETTVPSQPLAETGNMESITDIPAEGLEKSNGLPSDGSINENINGPNDAVLLESRAGSADIDAIGDSSPQNLNKIDDEIENGSFGLPPRVVVPVNADENLEDAFHSQSQSDPSSPGDVTITLDENSTGVPFMSMSDLLKKIKENSLKIEKSSSESLPSPVTAEDPVVSQGDYVVSPLKPIDNAEDFPTYDIDVGTSIITGPSDLEPVGVGQVIPVDLHQTDIPSDNRPPHTPALHLPAPIPKTTTTRPQPSFLDTFLNLLAGSASSNKDSNNRRSTVSPTNFRPPPLTGMRAPPLRISGLENNSPMGNVLLPSDLMEDDVSVDPNQPVVEINGGIPINALPANFIPSRGRPSLLHPLQSNLNSQIAGMRAPPFSDDDFKPSSFERNPNVRLPDAPLSVIAEEKVDVNPEIVDEPPKFESELTPTLPPSLPNLQIIPFVAADALSNQDSNSDDNQSSTATRTLGSCDDGERLWKNGETVDRGNGNPCILCRCHFGKIICQRQECPAVPEGCTSESVPAEGECCPQITCDESLNISIINTLPKFKPLDDGNSDSLSTPVRPSPFAHQNRRPPFVPASRRPKPAKPLSELRKSFIGPLKKRPASILNTGNEEKEEKVFSRRPLRPRPDIPRPENSRPEFPSVVRPSLTGESPPSPVESPPSLRNRPASPLSNERVPPFNKDRPRPSPFSRDRPRPFSQVRAGTRRPFLPPRVRVTTTKKRLPDFVALSKFNLPPQTTEKPAEPKEETRDTNIASSIPVSGTVTFAKDEEDSSAPSKARPFSHLFEILSKNKNSLPKPIHQDSSSVAQEVAIKPEKPFILPSDLLLPKPITPSRLPIDENIINVVPIDNGEEPDNEIIPDLEINVQTPKTILHPFKSPSKPLPEIPEFVKAQLPLGNDPILVSGLLELAGCNVYGRMFEIGERIKDISGQCKVCQCTKVGVQCLPIC